MQSNGGTITSAMARLRPMYMIELGLAAGVLGAGRPGERAETQERAILRHAGESWRSFVYALSSQWRKPEAR